MTSQEKIPILTNEEEQQEPLKLILVGDYGSGKSSLVHRHIAHTFKEGQYFGSKGSKVKLRIKIRDEKRTLLICETNGEEKYKSVNYNHFKHADMAVIVFDVSNSQSYESLDYW